MNKEGLIYDPICGKRVDQVGAEMAEYKRKKYFFCSSHCRARFQQHAERIRLHDLAKMGVLFAKSKTRWGLA
jgi:YHS domain-containing protein